MSAALGFFRTFVAERLKTFDMSQINKKSIYRVVTAASTNAAVVKAGPAEVSGLVVANATAGNYLKVYDKATTPNQNDTPLLTILLAEGVNVLPGRVQTENGLSVRVVAAAADNGITVAAAGQIVQLLYV